jgi:alpha-1,3-rhamnosyl/mannosyltransferase
MKIRIATIYTLYGQRGGAELFSEKLIENLSYSKKVSIVVFGNKKAGNVLSYKKNIEFVYVRWLNNQAFKTIWLEYMAWIYMIHYHINLFWNPSGANHFPGLFFPKTISTILDIGEYFVKNKYGYFRRFYRTKVCLPRTMKRSGKIVTISKATATAVKEIFNYKDEIKVIYLAADPWNDNKISNNKSLGKGSLNFNEEKYLLCVGRIDYINKGIDIILDSYIDLQKSYDMPKLVFVGSLGMDGTKLSKVLTENNLTGKVQYFGRVDNNDLEILYKKATINILASRYEGFGITLLESFMRGVPVLCSNIKVLKEIGIDAPIYFQSESVTDFKEKLMDLLQSRINIKRHRERGYEIAKQYSWDKTTEEYLSVFQLEYNKNHS